MNVSKFSSDFQIHYCEDSISPEARKILCFKGCLQNFTNNIWIQNFGYLYVKIFPTIFFKAHCNSLWSHLNLSLQRFYLQIRSHLIQPTISSNNGNDTAKIILQTRFWPPSPISLVTVPYYSAQVVVQVYFSTFSDTCSVAVLVPEFSLAV